MFDIYIIFEFYYIIMYLRICNIYVKYRIYFNSTTYNIIYTVDDLLSSLDFSFFVYCFVTVQQKKKKQEVLAFCEHSLTSISRAGDSRFLGWQRMYSTDKNVHFRILWKNYATCFTFLFYWFYFAKDITLYN